VNALSRLPEPALAVRAIAALARLPDPAPPLRMLAGRLAETAPELLEPLRRLLMEEARPDLALALIEGLPAAELGNPATVFRQAEAEARAGFPGSALTRLLALRTTEGLPPGAGALLADLALREGRLDEAFSVAAGLPAEAWPPELALRLQQAARIAGRPELFRGLDPARLAARPEIAALVALARGDRAAAGRFARIAVERPPAADGGADPRRRAARARPGRRGLGASARRARPGAARRRFGAALRRALRPAGARGHRPAAAERLRGTSPAAAEGWLRLALLEGRREEAAAFLRERALLPARMLAETLSAAAADRDSALADAAAAALRGRRDLPAGWTPEEVDVTAGLARPLGPEALASALDFLASAGESEARRRVIALLGAAPEIAAAAAARDPGRHPAIARLRREAEAPEGEGAITRLALLAVLSPREAVPLLARRAAAEPGRFGGALALARLRAEGPEAGEAELRRLLPRLPRPQQEGALFLMLAAAPGDAQPGLRRIAEETLGPDWRRGYEASLTRTGRRAELVAALRARGAAPDLPVPERRAIAQRLLDLGDLEGAEAVMR
jgi:hypothetical protein